MINIYCLVDPRDGKPFYVGATNCRLNTRLSGHISESKTILPQYWNNKNKLINSILRDGKRPRIRLLKVATMGSVDHYEFFFYSMLTQHGFVLIQRTTAFHYKKRMIKLMARRSDNQHLRQYSKLYFKNILIIIW